MSKCSHKDVVYSGEAYMTAPPKYIWLCCDCGYDGLLQTFDPPPFDFLRFTEVLEKFYGAEAAAPFKKLIQNNRYPKEK